MTSAVHDYSYSVLVKGRFDLLASNDFNTEDPDILLSKLKSQKRERKLSGAANKTLGEHGSSVAVIRDDKPVVQSGRAGGEVAEGRRDDAVDARGPRGRGNFGHSKPTKPGAQREFDRHSGSDKSGVKAVVKKDGHGTGNWGTIEDELEGQLEEPVMELEDQEQPTDAQESAAVVEEPKTLTLKEYKEQQKSSKANVSLSTKGTRRPNDGKNVFSDMVKVHKSKPVEPQVEVTLENVAIPDAKIVYFDPVRGKTVTRGATNRSTGEPRGRRTGTYTERLESEQNATEQTEIKDAPMPDGEHYRGGRPRGRGQFNPERNRGALNQDHSRGAYNSERGRGSFNSERGRGVFNPERGRGSFNPERGRGSFNPERGRGGFNAERGRGGFNIERGRGGFNPERGRGGFNPERGRGGFNPERGRGGFNTERGRGGFNPERGRGGFNPERGRGRGFAGRPHRDSFQDENEQNFQNGERVFRGGRGSFRRGRGGHEYLERGRDAIIAAEKKAPSMDSEADFPALK